MLKTRVSALALAVLMTASATGVHAASEREFSDFPDDWSAGALSRAVENGLLKGAGDGRIMPKGIVTRAQMAAIVSNAFGAKEGASLDSFHDLKADSWYRDSIAAAVRMGVISGSDGLMRPDDPISRQEACVVLAQLFSLEPGNHSVLDSYSDGSQTSSWARDGLSAMVEKGYITGYGDTLNPNGSITRAELSQLMDNMAGTYLTAENQNIRKGNVVLRESDASVKDVVIDGDLIIADGVKEAVLENVTVTGAILIRGGTDRITLKNTTSNGVVADVPVDAAQLELQSSKVGSLSVKSDLLLSGDVQNLVITQPSDVKLLSGTVSKAEIAKGAEGSELSVSAGASVSSAVVSADHSHIKGKGNVEKVTVNADSASVRTPATKVSVSKGCENVTVGGVGVKGGSNVTTNQNGSGLKPTGGSTGGTSSSGGSSGQEDSGSKPVKPVEAKLAEEAKLVDLGWSQFAAIRFAEGYSLNNCSVSVDGVDVTEAVTPVTDDGSIVKWEVTDLGHSKLVISGGDKTQIFELNKTSGKAPMAAESGVPDYFLINGPVYVWDYHLTNYDDAGNVRVNPSRTTIRLDGVSSASVAHYSPDAELISDDSELPYFVKGEALLMFNYEQGTEREKAFVDGITDVDLVSYNEYKNTLNDSLVYELDKEFVHGDHTVACIKVPLGQENFYSNGRYYLRVTSNGEASLFPIHVVNEIVPTMTLTGDTGYTQKEVHLRIKNMTYGVTAPIYRVELTNPVGEVFELAKFDDWFLHGDLLVLYNDHTNYFPVSGSYTVKVYADGFKTFSKTFYQEAFASEAPAGASLDAISTASVSGGGSSGGGEGGGDTKVMNANLILDTDLLVNAELLTELGVKAEAAEGIVQRWNDMNKLYVFNEGGEEVYTAEGYFDAVNTARTQGKYLTFDDYAAGGEGETTLNRPYAVKKVLEDNLLGETTTFREAVGIAVPELTLAEQTEKTAVLTCTDKAYLSKLAESGELELNKSFPLLPKDQYAVDEEKGTLTLNSVKLGKNTLKVRVPGYQTIEKIFYIDKVMEKVDLTAAEITRGEPLTITCRTQHDVCDFFANVTGIKITAPNGKSDNVYEQGIESAFDQIGYTVDGSTLTIGKDEFNESFAQNQDGSFAAGEYKIIITAEYYGDRTLYVNVKDTQTAKAEAPAVESVTYVKPFIGGNYYHVAFQGSEESTADYVKVISGVTINGKSVTKVSTFFNNTNSYKTSNDPSYGGAYRFLDFTEDCFKGNVEVIISAGGYSDLTFQLKNGQTAGKTSPAPTVKELKQENDSVNKYFRMSFQENAAEYLPNITAITLNGTQIKKVSNLFSETGAYKFSNDPVYGGDNCFIDFTADCFGKDNAELVITAKGFDDLKYTVEGIKAPDEHESGSDPSLPAAPAVVSVEPYSTFFDKFYLVKFKGTEDEAAEYAKKITTVSAEGINVSYSVVSDPVYGGKSCIVRVDQSVFAGEKTVVISADGYADLVFKVKNGTLVK